MVYISAAQFLMAMCSHRRLGMIRGKSAHLKRYQKNIVLAEKVERMLFYKPRNGMCVYI